MRSRGEFISDLSKVLKYGKKFILLVNNNLDYDSYDNDLTCLVKAAMKQHKLIMKHADKDYKKKSRCPNCQKEATHDPYDLCNHCRKERALTERESVETNLRSRIMTTGEHILQEDLSSIKSIT